jgi:hypothetical protein
MKTKNPTNLLFLTNFSEPCFRSIPSVAEWMDSDQRCLTILHVHGPGKAPEADAQRQLRSFFAEADRYSSCERVLLSGPPGRVITDYCRQTKPDLVFAPAAAASGFPRIGHQSIRAKLIRDAGMRIWTAGRNEKSTQRRVVKNVAYVLTGHTDWMAEALLAARTAQQWNAMFHLIYPIPMQEIHEGMLASDIVREHPGATVEALRELGASLPGPVSVHASIGNERIELPRILQECGADLVFIGEGYAVDDGWLGVEINSGLQKLNCELICLPDGNSRAKRVNEVTLGRWLTSPYSIR